MLPGAVRSGHRARLEAANLRERRAAAASPGCRDLHYAQQGTIGKPLLTDQTEQAWCLTVLTNAVITGTTEYYQLAVQDLRAKGRAVPGELLAHISPAHSENVNFFGVITIDVEAELAKLDTGGWRPLRPIAPDPGLFP